VGRERGRNVAGKQYHNLGEKNRGSGDKEYSGKEDAPVVEKKFVRGAETMVDQSKLESRGVGDSGAVSAWQGGLRR